MPKTDDTPDSPETESVTEVQAEVQADPEPQVVQEPLPPPAPDLEPIPDPEPAPAPPVAEAPVEPVPPPPPPPTDVTIDGSAWPVRDVRMHALDAAIRLRQTSDTTQTIEAARVFFDYLIGGGSPEALDIAITNHPLNQPTEVAQYAAIYQEWLDQPLPAS